ncbi:MAG: hypothetical protein V7651_06905 [Hyphomonas oceanitis]|uniref:cold-shock protein n=1 Tax=Hyphomonas oceanitis TaxID=81033 RepID=UPI0030012ADE
MGAALTWALDQLPSGWKGYFIVAIVFLGTAYLLIILIKEFLSLLNVLPKRHNVRESKLATITNVNPDKGNAFAKVEQDGTNVHIPPSVLAKCGIQNLKAGDRVSVHFVKNGAGYKATKVQNARR